MADLAKFVGGLDVQKIAKRMDDKERKCLFGSAAYARKVMKSRIRKRKRAGEVGGYPSSHEGTLKKLIRFDVNLKTGEAAVGPTLFKSPDWLSSTAKTIPELLADGGTVTVLAGDPPKQIRRVYEPRPFPQLTLGEASERLAHNMEQIPL